MVGLCRELAPTCCSVHASLQGQEVAELGLLLQVRKNKLIQVLNISNFENVSAVHAPNYRF